MSSVPQTVEREGLRAMSADPEDRRILRLHFEHDVTDADRAMLVEAINARRKHAELVKSLRKSERELTLGSKSDALRIIKRMLAKLGGDS